MCISNCAHPDDGTYKLTIIRNVSNKRFYPFITAIIDTAKHKQLANLLCCPNLNNRLHDFRISPGLTRPQV